MRIIPEEPHHRQFALALSRLAFNSEDETRLIEALDRDGDVVSSLIAIEAENEVVGHILFSRLDVTIEGDNVMVAALAPMAVAPAHQNRGIGSQLVLSGIDAMKIAGRVAIIVLGHERFYPRFGFRHDLVGNLACRFNQFDAFMGLELTAGSLGGKVGVCRYPKAFDLL